MTSPRPRVRGLGAAVALTALTAAALPAGAHAASTGATTIQLGGAAAAALSAGDVRIGARKPAKAGARRIVLPVASGAVATGATLRHRGSLTFRARVGGRARTVKLTALQTRVTARAAKVSAKLGSKRVVVFALAAPKRRIALDKTTGRASLRGGTATLTRAGARALRSGLAVRGIARGKLGSVKVTAKVDPPRVEQPRATTPVAPGPTTPAPPTPTPRDCQGFAIGAVPTASAPLARPVTAGNVLSAPMTWYPRDSWIRYASSGVGAGDGIHATQGATGGPVEAYPTADSPRLVYSFDFTFAPATSWYDAAAKTGLLTYTGSVRFLWAEHGIDIAMTNPEIELNGTASRVVFTVIGAACSNLPPKRVEILKLASAAPAASGVTFAYPRLDARLATPGASAFGGSYLPDTEWGSIQRLVVTTG